MDTSKTCYLFLDFDGTVSLNGTTVPPETRDVLKTVQSAGHQVILNTGRSRGVHELGTEGRGRQFVIAELEGVESEDAANRLRGVTVYAAREDLPLKAGAFFIADLIGTPSAGRADLSVL